MLIGSQFFFLFGTYPYSSTSSKSYACVEASSGSYPSVATSGGVGGSNSNSAGSGDSTVNTSRGQGGVDCHLMPSTDEIDKLLEKRGEWVYELYAVLNHSGAISGGHYYAYIKNLETKKWYNFNDSNVSEISGEKVFEAWGGKSKYEGPCVLYNLCFY